MYSATPASKRAWSELLGWVLERAGLGWEIVEYAAPAPLGALWERDDLGCAMMCGLPWSRRRPRPILVAAPVPSPVRYDGKPIYFTDIGPLDSYYHDLLKRGDAELAAKVKTVASTAAAPIPPFVATGMVANADLARLRSALDAASTAPEVAAQRAALLLDRLTVPAESDYDALASVLDAATRYPDAW